MNPDPVASPGVTWLADADSLETECRMDRIDFIYYQGKTIQAIASECYDNSLGKTFTFKGEDFSILQIMVLSSRNSNLNKN